MGNLENCSNVLDWVFDGINSNCGWMVVHGAFHARCEFLITYPTTYFQLFITKLPSPCWEALFSLERIIQFDMSNCGLQEILKKIEGFRLKRQIRTSELVEKIKAKGDGLVVTETRLKIRKLSFIELRDQLQSGKLKAADVLEAYVSAVSFHRFVRLPRIYP